VVGRNKEQSSEPTEKKAKKLGRRHPAVRFLPVGCWVPSDHSGRPYETLPVPPAGPNDESEKLRTRRCAVSNIISSSAFLAYGYDLGLEVDTTR
jgi:hypothetical protein